MHYSETPKGLLAIQQTIAKAGYRGVPTFTVQKKRAREVRRLAAAGEPYRHEKSTTSLLIHHENTKQIWKQRRRRHNDKVLLSL